MSLATVSPATVLPATLLPLKLRCGALGLAFFLVSCAAQRHTTRSVAPPQVGSTPREAEQPAAEPTAPPKRQVRACLWNLKKLGHGSRKDIGVVANAINSHCDLLVVVEVMQRQQGHPGYDDLLKELLKQGNWQGRVTRTPRPNTSSSNSEFYAVLIRQPQLNWCEPPLPQELRFIADDDGASGKQGSFRREPAFTCVVFSDESRRFDFLVGAFHAIWDSGRRASIEAEVGALQAALTQLEQDYAPEKDILLFGDMNLTTDVIAQVTPLFDCPLHALGSAPSHGNGTTLRSDGARTSNTYDHLFVLHPEKSPEVAQSGRILDLRSEVADEQTFYQTVSDHLPIVVDLSLLGPDDD